MNCINVWLHWRKNVLYYTDSPIYQAGVTQQLVDAGAIDVLLTVMDLAPQSAGLQEAATYALCNICATPGVFRVLQWVGQWKVQLVR